MGYNQLYGVLHMDFILILIVLIILFPAIKIMSTITIKKKTLQKNCTPPP